jgi:hypothetical protein
MSSAFTKALCDAITRQFWQREAEATKQAVEQSQREDMFPSTWESSRGCRSPLGTGFARPAAEKEPQR